MKTFIYIAVLSVSFLFACNKKLDLDPIGSVSQDNFYKSADDALAAVAACYNSMLRIASQGTWNVSGYELYGDIQSSDVESHPDIVDYQQIQQYTLQPTNTTVQAEWAVIYQGIYRTSLAIEKIPAIEMDEALKARLVAEAYFLRGWWQFRLAKIFGEAPLVTKTLTLDELYIPKSPQQDLFDQAEKDLLEAEKVLPPSYDDANLGRATSGAAKAFLAELYLWEKKWTEAKTKLEDIIALTPGTYSLVDSYTSLFDGTNDNSKESIFEIQYTANTGKDLGNFGTVMSAPNGEGFIPGGGWGWTRPTQDLVNEFEKAPKEDPRLSYSIFRKGDNFEGHIFSDVVNGTGFAIRKWCISGSTSEIEAVFPWQTSANFILMRLADVYLMYAEVMNELSNQATAVEYINKVRARPSVNMPLLSTSLNKDQVFEAIRHERRVELCFEGKTGYDLRRWGIAKAFLTSPQRWQNDMSINPQYGGNYFKYVEGKNQWLPIPQVEIDRSNGTLTQHDGW